MGQSNEKQETPSETSSDGQPQEGEKKLKPCCACPETKKIRDACIMEKGEDACLAEINAHKDCMRKLGFKV